MIIIDTREQHPFDFQGPTQVGTLATGDYSILGLEHLIAVERKSLDDLLACIGRERARFKRELQRLRACRFRMLVIEATAQELSAGEWRGKLQPAHVMGSLAAWTCQFELPVWMGGNHEEAGRFVERYLHQCARRVAAENEASVGHRIDAA